MRLPDGHTLLWRATLTMAILTTGAASSHAYYYGYPYTGAARVLVKLPDGTRSSRRFPKDSPLQVRQTLTLTLTLTLALAASLRTRRCRQGAVAVAAVVVIAVAVAVAVHLRGSSRSRSWRHPALRTKALLTTHYSPLTAYACSRWSTSRASSSRSTVSSK